MLIGKQQFSVFKTAARGLEAQRIALGAAAENIANANTTRTADGGRYEIKRAVHQGPESEGLRFADMLGRMQTRIEASDASHQTQSNLLSRLPEGDLGPTTEVEQEGAWRPEYDPTHPHADENGYVHYPDVNVVEEMSRMISANRVYEANLSSVQAAKEMIKRTLEI